MFTPGKPIYFRPFIGAPFHPIYNWIRGPPCTRAPTWRIIPEPWHRCFKRERENQKSPRGTISIFFVCAQRHMGCSFVALTQWKTHILCWLDFRRAEGRAKTALTEVQKASRKKKPRQTKRKRNAKRRPQRRQFTPWLHVGIPAGIDQIAVQTRSYTTDTRLICEGGGNYFKMG